MTDPLIIALDVETASAAFAIVDRLGNNVSFYKVGLELFTAAGSGLVRELRERGKQVFLDLKFFDIGETVKRATAQAVKSGAAFLTVYGSPSIVRAAVEGRGDSDLKILAVTVLTSWTDEDIQEDGYALPLRELVLQRARQAHESGADGCIASALEARAIREEMGSELLLVTPGVRSAGAATGDQKRVATPAESLANGADYLVIGRQVTRASDPVASVRTIREEIAPVFAVRT